MQEHGPWQIVQSHDVYRDPWTVVRKDDVIRPDGQPGTHTFTANVVSPTRLYLARKLNFGDHAPEGTEQIRCLKMPLTEAVHKIMASEITHGPSCVLILKTASLLG